jgi:signal transduction histidine kinase
MAMDARQGGRRMRLADFILANIEPILVEWESFARNLTAGGAMDVAGLRDHAEDILKAVASDMETVQSLARQSEKSRGRGAGGAASRRLDSASTVHGAGRVESGFKLLEVVSEYRALRASVLRLWRESGPAPDLHDLDDVTRFNESIDQSLANAVEGYTDHVDRSRRMFMAILGHDLRNPLSAVTLAAKVVQQEASSDKPSNPLLSVIVDSTEAMSDLIDDLMDFAHSGLGHAFPLEAKPFSVDSLCKQVVAEHQVAHPQRQIRGNCDGALIAHIDPARIRQVISNLVGNAIQHGRPDTPVELSLAAEGPLVVIRVSNQGNPIPPQELHHIFDPMTRASTVKDVDDPAFRGSIGLGLYIARAIVMAHKGTIDVTSTAAEGTCFTVRLPREATPRPTP